MSVRYDSTDRLLGVPLTRYRDAVSAWGKARPGRVPATARRLGLTPEEFAVCVDDATSRGLLAGPEGGFAPSRAGIALIGASPLRPIPAARGEAILRALVERAAAANEREDLPFHVERIWLYGSLATGAAEVNDVDVVVEVAHDMSILFDPERGMALIRMAEEMGGASALRRRMGALANAMRHVRDRTLYGERRNPRLSIGVLDELVDMNCPCRLVFDVDLGGPVDEPTIPHHPDSPGYCRDMPERSVLPDLVSVGAAAPVAMAIALRTAHGTSGDEDVDRVLHTIRATHAEVSDLPLGGWIAARGSFDGRSRAALRIGDGCAIVVERGMDGEGNVTANVVDGVALGRPAPTHHELDALAHVLATAMACDARKSGMRGDGPTSTVRPESTGGPGWTEMVTVMAEGRLDPIGTVHAPRP